MINTTVICGFSGIGKTEFYKRNKSISVLDSDSSKFSKLDNGLPNPAFPDNYLIHIKENIGEVDFILVSTHQDVRDLLVENGIMFLLVYPDYRGSKKEYISRWEKRRSPQQFINVMSHNFNDFVASCQNEPDCIHVKLRKGEYLSDVVVV